VGVGTTRRENTGRREVQTGGPRSIAPGQATGIWGSGDRGSCCSSSARGRTHHTVRGDRRAPRFGIARSPTLRAAVRPTSNWRVARNTPSRSGGRYPPLPASDGPCGPLSAAGVQLGPDRQRRGRVRGRADWMSSTPGWSQFADILLWSSDSHGRVTAVWSGRRRRLPASGRRKRDAANAA